MDIEIEEDAVLDVITFLREKKRRPDHMSIAKSTAKKHGQSSIATSSAIDRLLNKAAVHMRVNKTGNQSFFISKSNAERGTQGDIECQESQYDSENDTNMNDDMFEMRSIGVPTARSLTHLPCLNDQGMKSRNLQVWSMH